MALWLHVFGGYPSYRVSGEQWTQDDWDAHNLVMALKGELFNGYATMRRADGVWVKFDKNNRGPAFDVFGSWAAERLKQAGVRNPLLVPVPASSCVDLNADEKGYGLVQAIAKFLPGASPFSALCWSEPIPKARGGGPRHPDVLYEKLMIADEIPQREVVLVDDVVTKSGHIRACARALRDKPRIVRHAICAAQTVMTHPADMFDIQPRDLDVEAY